MPQREGPQTIFLYMVHCVHQLRRPPNSRKQLQATGPTKAAARCIRVAAAGKSHPLGPSHRSQIDHKMDLHQQIVCLFVEKKHKNPVILQKCMFKILSSKSKERYLILQVFLPCELKLSLHTNLWLSWP